MAEIINIKSSKKRSIDVILHSARRMKRGRKSSKPFSGVNNPRLANIYAIYSFKFMTETEGISFKELCFALFDENEDVNIPGYALVEDKNAYPEILERLLNEEDTPKKRCKYAATINFTNSLVIAQGDDVESVFREAKRKGVDNPVLVHLSPEPQIPSVFSL